MRNLFFNENGRSLASRINDVLQFIKAMLVAIQDRVHHPVLELLIDLMPNDNRNQHEQITYNPTM